MALRQLVGVLLVLLLVSGAVAPAVAGRPAGTSSLDGAALAQENLSQPTFVITVYENGSARWTFQYTRPLNNETARDNFEAFASDFENDSTELYTNFRNRARTLTTTGTDATGREMNATAFSRRAYVGDLGNRGVVEMSFLWTGFAETDGDRVLVGDVFEGGLYLAPGQRLRIERGPALVFTSGVNPAPDSTSGPSLAESDSLTWLGERQFTDEHPQVPLGLESGAATTEPTDATATPTADATAAPGGGPGLMALFGLVVVLLLGLGAAGAWRTGALDGLGAAGAASADDGDDDEGGAGAPATDGTSTGPTGGVEGDPAVPDEELLSDEDRVLRLLEENGGRMKQVNIVEETGWSKSKVSMLLSDMEEEDTISKLRVGRENVISLRGHEPDAAKSPFDEEE
jgi:hypothetical protein